jgi:Spy/CpxP family protein refolding chaperone
VPEIKAALKITPSQERQIRACQKEVMDKVTALENQRKQQINLIPRPSNPKDEAAVAAYKKKVEDQIVAFRKVDLATISGYENEGKAKALKVLTAQQRKAWANMLGPKWNAK